MNRSFPGSLRRLSEEVRAACRAAVSPEGDEASSAHAPSHRVALGEWLGAVRQPRGEFVPPSPLRQRRGFFSFSPEEPRGDLSRTHIMRLKGERAHLDDGIDRARRYAR